MKKLFGMTLLLMVSMIVGAQEAQETVAQEVVVSISADIEGGTVTVKEKNGQEVTITVAPAVGYYIRKADVEVIAVRDPAAATRGDEEAQEEEQLPAGVTLTLEGVDPEDLTEARDYSFTVPDGLGAWVRTATFHEVDKPETSGKLNDDVSWEVTTDTEAKTAVVTLTLEGDGSASLDDETTVPWEAFKDQITNMVVGKGVQELGKDLLKGCTALKTITLEGTKFVPLGENTLPEGVTVDVYGVLYNEYKDDADWGTATIASTGSEKMEGVAFGTQNQYDVFVTKQPMLIPSVLKGYTVTAIDGANVKISAITDGIIPAGVAVLLFSETVNDDDFRTVVTEEKGTAEAGLLRAAGSGGQPVALGEVYLLYNDVFYLSQEGTIPEGGVYIPVSDGTDEQGKEEKKDELKKTRSFLTIGDDNTTAINPSRLSPFTSHSSDDAWYSLDGRRLNGAPTRKGVYINNGCKVIVK